MLKHYSSEEANQVARLYNKYKYIMQREAYYILFDTSEAEDAVQQAFIKIANSLDKIDEDQPAMTCSFLKIVTRNVAKDMYRKKMYLRSDEDASGKVVDRNLNTTSGVSKVVISKDATERIMNAIMNLPEIYRDVLIVERLQGFSREESTKILNSNYETVKKRLTRARAKLQEALREEESEDE